MSDKPVILVVDDDAPILGLMQSLLRSFGFQPVTAMNGESALNAAKSQPPALILLDKNMPGMPTADIIHGLRSAAGAVPILIVTGDPMDRGEIGALGVDGAIQKPFDVPRLIQEIRERIEKSSPC